MKTNLINTAARVCGLTITLAILAGSAAALRSADNPTAKGGGSKLLEITGRSVNFPRSEPSNYKPMSCAKCKDEYLRRVDWTSRGANKPVLTVARHLCEGCGNTWVVSGHGKAKVSAPAHTCASCGAASLACCSTSASGTALTKGMEKNLNAAPAK